MRVNPLMAIRSDRLRILWSLWTLGALILCRVALFLALIGAGAYALIGAAALLLGFDPLPWFRVSALIWAPSAAGFALGGITRRMKADRSREGRPPGLELAAGWSVGGLAMREKPNWINTGAALIVIGGIAFADLAPVMLGIEFVDWVASGEWRTLAIAGGLVLPFSLCLFVLGLLLCVEGLNLGDWSFRGRAPPIA